MRNRVGDLLRRAASDRPRSMAANYRKWGFSRRTFQAALKIRNGIIDARYGTGGAAPIWGDLRDDVQRSILLIAADRAVRTMRGMVRP